MERSAADRAYHRALALIEQVRREGVDTISFDYPDFRALNRIPPEIAMIGGLTEVNLANTQVSDLSPLSALSTLEGLSLYKTQVKDLRPIRTLPLSGEFAGGLCFADTPATLADPELARLAAIEDSDTRTRQVLEYLATLPRWPRPLPWL